jgi:hypothetical protein
MRTQKPWGAVDAPTYTILKLMQQYIDECSRLKQLLGEEQASKIIQAMWKQTGEQRYGYTTSTHTLSEDHRTTQP